MLVVGFALQQQREQARRDDRDDHQPQQTAAPDREPERDRSDRGVHPERLRHAGVSWLGEPLVIQRHQPASAERATDQRRQCDHTHRVDHLPPRIACTLAPAVRYLRGGDRRPQRSNAGERERNRRRPHGLVRSREQGHTTMKKSKRKITHRRETLRFLIGTGLFSVAGAYADTGDPVGGGCVKGLLVDTGDPVAGCANLKASPGALRCRGTIAIADMIRAVRVQRWHGLRLTSNAGVARLGCESVLMAARCVGGGCWPGSPWRPAACRVEAVGAVGPGDRRPRDGSGPGERPALATGGPGDRWAWRPAAWEAGAPVAPADC